ncbi:glycosyltransferase family 2 protein [Prevotella nigrescens]|uniref:glycosyltransferase family A protein n=1 Tax=Prevotella nigrescens TaxID=28133 RepID=UPI0028D356B5|nr:glycosyltransferase family 2 protein [Prevotella nigrescens]
MLITVFTPTYNRGRLLPRLYDSLCKQNNKDFEWVIVDDGSTDDTEIIVKLFIDQSKEANFPIRYFKKENGGKHTAINLGVKLAVGELFFIVDSDDYLPNDSLRNVVVVYEGVRDNNEFAGICGLDADPTGKVIGKGLSRAILDCTLIQAEYVYHLIGDKKEVYKTSVLRAFPFPEIKGERFCPENLVWYRIARQYKLRYFNTVIYIADYQPGGITDKMVEVRRKSPRLTCLYYRELLTLQIPLKYRVRGLINFIRYKINLI